MMYDATSISNKAFKNTEEITREKICHDTPILYKSDTLYILYSKKTLLKLSGSIPSPEIRGTNLKWLQLL